MTRENFLLLIFFPLHTKVRPSLYVSIPRLVSCRSRSTWNVGIMWLSSDASHRHCHQMHHKRHVACVVSLVRHFSSRSHITEMKLHRPQKKRGYFPQKLSLNLETEQMKAEKKRSNIRSDVQFPSRKRPFYFSQTVVETEVDEKWAITEGFDSGSVITLQISDFPSFICRLFIAAAFLHENKMISLRQHNARNNRLGQTFAEAWWAWLTITEFHCGFSLLFFLFPPRPFIHPLFWKAVFFF